MTNHALTPPPGAASTRYEDHLPTGVCPDEAALTGWPSEMDSGERSTRVARICARTGETPLDVRQRMLEREYGDLTQHGDWCARRGARWRRMLALAAVALGLVAAWLV